MTAYHLSSQRGLQRHYPATPDLARMSGESNPLAHDICRTLHIWPSEIDLSTARGLKSVEAQLHRALREQRRRALAGHWNYDIACHARLVELHGRLKLRPHTKPLCKSTRIRRQARAVNNDAFVHSS